MNWVGGARNRVKLQGDRQLQKEFFEKKRLDRLHEKNQKSLQSHRHRNRKISQDLIALHTVSNATVKVGGSPRKAKVQHIDLDRKGKGDNLMGRRLHRIPERVELPFSPELCPSELLLIDSQSKGASQTGRLCENGSIQPLGFSENFTSSHESQCHTNTVSSREVQHSSSARQSTNKSPHRAGNIYQTESSSSGSSHSRRDREDSGRHSSRFPCWTPHFATRNNQASCQHSPSRSTLSQSRFPNRQKNIWIPEDTQEQKEYPLITHCLSSSPMIPMIACHFSEAKTHQTVPSNIKSFWTEDDQTYPGRFSQRQLSDIGTPARYQDQSLEIDQTSMTPLYNLSSNDESRQCIPKGQHRKRTSTPAASQRPPSVQSYLDSAQRTEDVTLTSYLQPASQMPSSLPNSQFPVHANHSSHKNYDSSRKRMKDMWLPEDFQPSPYKSFGDDRPTDDTRPFSLSAFSTSFKRPKVSRWEPFFDGTSKPSTPSLSHPQFISSSQTPSPDWTNSLHRRKMKSAPSYSTSAALSRDTLSSLVGEHWSHSDSEASSLKRLSQKARDSAQPGLLTKHPLPASKRSCVHQRPNKPRGLGDTTHHHIGACPTAGDCIGLSGCVAVPSDKYSTHLPAHPRLERQVEETLMELEELEAFLSHSEDEKCFHQQPQNTSDIGLFHTASTKSTPKRLDECTSLHSIKEKVAEASKSTYSEVNEHDPLVDARSPHSTEVCADSSVRDTMEALLHSVVTPCNTNTLRLNHPSPVAPSRQLTWKSSVFTGNGECRQDDDSTDGLRGVPPSVGVVDVPTREPTSVCVSVQTDWSSAREDWNQGKRPQVVDRGVQWESPQSSQRRETPEQTACQQKEPPRVPASTFSSFSGQKLDLDSPVLTFCSSDCTKTTPLSHCLSLSGLVGAPVTTAHQAGESPSSLVTIPVTTAGLVSIPVTTAPTALYTESQLPVRSQGTRPSSSLLVSQRHRESTLMSSQQRVNLTASATATSAHPYKMPELFGALQNKSMDMMLSIKKHTILSFSLSSGVTTETIRADMASEQRMNELPRSVSSCNPHALTKLCTEMAVRQQVLNEDDKIVASDQSVETSTQALLPSEAMPNISDCLLNVEYTSASHHPG